MSHHLLGRMRVVVAAGVAGTSGGSVPVRDARGTRTERVVVPRASFSAFALLEASLDREVPQIKCKQS